MTTNEARLILGVGRKDDLGKVSRVRLVSLVSPLPPMSLPLVLPLRYQLSILSDLLLFAQHNSSAVVANLTSLHSSF